MCVVYLKTPENNKWQEICRTEVIDNSLNPDFTTKVSTMCRYIGPMQIDKETNSSEIQPLINSFVSSKSEITT